MSEPIISQAAARELLAACEMFLADYDPDTTTEQFFGLLRENGRINDGDQEDDEVESAFEFMIRKAQEAIAHAKADQADSEDEEAEADPEMMAAMKAEMENPLPGGTIEKLAEIHRAIHAEPESGGGS